ncbi:MAG: vitamin K-dependent gamma-carboxylase [Planctomycetota bacterium]|nr:MAG: vitamin K-dependent gamma-carboxylase [Planctomycetota bacterium]REK22821.1 MAG: vitamin K-dependent gamma-carboxylase [Planctomycetota bacterium]REK31586.1 MAG: vitamin K-dependent gamma-carboxylase [Planctomycetota bacterium]
MSQSHTPGIPLRERLAQPVDVAAIAVFRIVFGLVLLWEVVRFFSYGWIRSYYIDPPVHFTYPGFAWVQPLPGEWMYGFFAVMGLLALCVMVGFAYRLSMPLLTFGFWYWFLLEKARYQNHFYLIGLLALILCCIPAHAAFSFDSWKKPETRRSTVPAWMLWLLRFQIAIPFVYGGIAKITPDWLRGEPMRIWLEEQAGLPVIGPWFTEEWVVYFFSYGGLIFDLVIIPLLIWRRTRVCAYCLALAFNLTNSQLFHIGIFPWFLIGATTIYFEPDWPRRVIRKLRGGIESANSIAPQTGGRPRLSRGLCGALIVYAALQCAIPFHHYLYPGPSVWSYEGEYFVWHMRLATKISGIRFHVTDPQTVQSVVHDPNELLPLWQADLMSVNPEMIRQYAHFLAERSSGQSGKRVEVRAEVLNSLNGREPQPLIDRQVDLAAIPFSIRPADWIVPLEDPLPGTWRPDPAVAARLLSENPR